MAGAVANRPLAARYRLAGRRDMAWGIFSIRGRVNKNTFLNGNGYVFNFPFFFFLVWEFSTSNMIYGSSSRVFHRYLKLKLTYAIASHINAFARGQRFLKLLASIANQTHGTDSAIVSISFEDAKTPNDSAIRLAIIATLTALKFMVLVQPNRLSQFEHYERIMQYLRNRGFGPSNWLLFSDDDDLWHETRTEHYQAGLLHHRSQIETCGNLRAFFEDGEDVVTSTGNYVDYCVQFSIFQEFFEKIATPQMLQHRFCDVRFVRFVRERKSRQTVMLLTKVLLYDWRKDSTYAHNCDPNDRRDLAEGLRSNLDLFLATHSRQTLEGWMIFSKRTLAAWPAPIVQSKSTRALFQNTFVKELENNVFRDRE
jgi:hypothetical protein